MSRRFLAEELYKFINKFASWICVDRSVRVDWDGERKDVSVDIFGRWAGTAHPTVLGRRPTPPLMAPEQNVTEGNRGKQHLRGILSDLPAR